MLQRHCRIVYPTIPVFNMYFTFGDSDAIVTENLYDANKLVWDKAATAQRVNQSYVVDMRDMPVSVLDIMCADVYPEVFYTVVRALVEFTSCHGYLKIRPLMMKYVISACNLRVKDGIPLSDMYIMCMYDQATILEQVAVSDVVANLRT